MSRKLYVFSGEETNTGQPLALFEDAISGWQQFEAWDGARVEVFIYGSNDPVVLKLTADELQTRLGFNEGG